MALIKCFECGGKLSTTAGACPHCGAPQSHGPKPLEWADTKPVKKRHIGLKVIGMFVGVIFVFVLASQYSQTDIDKFSRYDAAKERTSSGSAQLVKPEKINICKAAIAKVMGRDPSIMTSEESDMVSVSYQRDDGTNWLYRCTFQADRVIWALGDGRWRNHPADEILTYQIQGNTIEITESWSDGSFTKEAYSF